MGLKVDFERKSGDITSPSMPARAGSDGGNIFRDD